MLIIREPLHAFTHLLGFPRLTIQILRDFQKLRMMRTTLSLGWGRRFHNMSAMEEKDPQRTPICSSVGDGSYKKSILVRPSEVGERDPTNN